MATDPICGMTVDQQTALQCVVDGRTHYFCSDHCRQKFLSAVPQMTSPAVKALCCGHAQEQAKSEPPKHSQEYFCPMCPGVESDKPGQCPRCGMSLECARPAAVKGTALYTCPMHPEIQQDQPGSCPICGMALEPKTGQSQAEQDDPELRSMTLRFWVALALSIPVFLLAMLPMLGVPVERWLSTPWHSWIQLLLSTLAVLCAGLELHRDVEPEHVHAHCHRHRSGLPVQPAGNSLPGIYS
jgi:Cu+-exporting ATPase